MAEDEELLLTEELCREDVLELREDEVLELFDDDEAVPDEEDVDEVPELLDDDDRDDEEFPDELLPDDVDEAELDDDDDDEELDDDEEEFELRLFDCDDALLDVAPLLELWPHSCPGRSMCLHTNENSPVEPVCHGVALRQ